MRALRALLCLGAAAAFTGAAAGCASSARTPPSGSPPTTAARLSATLVLASQSVRTGGVISGRVEVRNETGHPVDAYGCGGIFAVLLTSGTYHPTPAWPACLEKITIPTGSSSYPVTIEARYNLCGAPDSPACTADGPPPLPPGGYEATTFESGDLVPLPRPVPVQVTG